MISGIKPQGLESALTGNGAGEERGPGSRRQRLLRYSIQRLLFVPVGAFALVVVTFLIVNLVPSNPGYQILGENATPEQIDAINEELGWNLPLPERFARYFSNLLRGDMGVTYYQNEKVTAAIARHLPNTIELVVPALLLSVLIGVTMAVLSIRGPRFLRRPLGGGITMVQALPDFLIAIFLIYFLYVRLRIAPPPVGRMPLAAGLPSRVTGLLVVDSILAGDWALTKELIRYLALPVVTLGLGISPLFGRVSQSMLLRAWQSPYVEFAQANGHSGTRVLRFVLRDIRGSIMTYFVIALASLVGGAAIIETIFSWNGIGRWGVGVMSQLDIPAVQGFVLVTTLGALVLYVVLDVVVAILDPRIEIGGKAMTG